MQSFTKATCQKLRADLNRVLAEYGATEGITFELGNIRFMAEELKITSVTARIAGARKKEERALDFKFSVYGLKEVNQFGDRLVEYNSRRYQYPFVYIKKADGRRYKTSLEGARCLFGESVPA